MADDKKKTGDKKRISPAERFRYIGFEVFPGKPKDLFKSTGEKDKLVETVLAKREHGDIIREDCTLMEDRVTLVDRIVLGVAAVAVILSLFLPWYAAYNEIIEEVKVEPVATADSLSMPVSDSLSLATTTDSLGAVVGEIADATTDDATESEAVAGEQMAATEIPTDGETAGKEGRYQKTAHEEIIHGYVAKKKIHKEFEYLSGFGSFGMFGILGDTVFSSGVILVISTILMLLFTLMCVGFPVYTLYGLFGLKGDSDSQALALKKIIKYNWIPVVLFLVILFISFFGAEYGFDAKGSFVSLGNSYGVGALLGSLTWGLLLALGGLVMLAVKGSEI